MKVRIALLIAFLATVPLARASTVTVTYGGCTGPSGKAGASSPCTLQIGKDAPFQAYNDDWTGLTSPNTWTAAVLSESQLSQAMFGKGTEGQQDYLQAFYLIEHEPAGGSYDYQMAIFALFNPGVETNNAGKYWTPGADILFDSVEAMSFKLSDFSGFEVMSPVVNGSLQTCQTDPPCPTEFIVPPSSSPTPEPSSLLLLGSGLVGLAGWLRRKV